MKSFPEQYYTLFLEAIKKIEVDIQGKLVDFYEAIQVAVDRVLDQKKQGAKLYFIGNGASAAIASHQATDFWKAGQVPATCFNDASLLTCISNDYGYKHVFEKPVEMFMKENDILMAISSSGESENILLASKAAKNIGSMVMTFSGKDSGNTLRSLGDINFYVPSMEYGHVEVIHHSICHCILDTIINERSPKKSSEVVEHSISF